MESRNRATVAPTSPSPASAEPFPFASLNTVPEIVPGVVTVAVAVANVALFAVPDPSSRQLLLLLYSYRVTVHAPVAKPDGSANESVPAVASG